MNIYREVYHIYYNATHEAKEASELYIDLLTTLENIKIRTKKNGTHYAKIEDNFITGGAFFIMSDRGYKWIEIKSKKGRFYFFGGMAHTIGISGKTFDEVMQAIEASKAKLKKQAEENLNLSKMTYEEFLQEATRY